MNQPILHEKKPRDALRASRGLKAVDAAKQDSQVNNTASTVSVKGDILPMVAWPSIHQFGLHLLIRDIGILLLIWVALQERSTRPSGLLKVNMTDSQLPEIRRARLGTLTIYEISEAELEIIERGSPDSLFLTFSIFLLSVAISFSVTLATTTITPDRKFQIFVIITVIGYVGGIVLLGLWLRSRKSMLGWERLPL